MIFISSRILVMFVSKHNQTVLWPPTPHPTLLEFTLISPSKNWINDDASKKPQLQHSSHTVVKMPSLEMYEPTQWWIWFVCMYPLTGRWCVAPNCLVFRSSVTSSTYEFLSQHIKWNHIILYYIILYYIIYPRRVWGSHLLGHPSPHFLPPP